MPSALPLHVMNVLWSPTPVFLRDMDLKSWGGVQTRVCEGCPGETRVSSIPLRRRTRQFLRGPHSYHVAGRAQGATPPLELRLEAPLGKARGPVCSMMESSFAGEPVRRTQGPPALCHLPVARQATQPPSLGLQSGPVWK